MRNIAGNGDSMAYRDDRESREEELRGIGRTLEKSDFWLEFPLLLLFVSGIMSYRKSL